MVKFAIIGALALGVIAFFMKQKSSAQQAAYNNVDGAQFIELMKQPNTVVLDVRTPQETAQAKIPGAIEIDFLAGNFAQKTANLDKSKTYLVYCRSGNRSGQACGIMSTQGFTGGLYNLVGGYNAWASKAR